MALTLRRVTPESLPRQYLFATILMWLSATLSAVLFSLFYNLSLPTDPVRSVFLILINGVVFFGGISLLRIADHFRRQMNELFYEKLLADYTVREVLEQAALTHALDNLD